MRAAALGPLLFSLGLLTPASAEQPTEALTVSVLHAASRCVADSVTASGVFVARRAVELRPDHEGLVVGDVTVEPGDVVAKDQVVARLVSPKAPAQEPVALKAPVAGTIIAANAVVGAYASASAGDPLFRIAEGGEVELEASTLAANLPQLHPGLIAKLHVVGLGDIDGRVVGIGDGVDARTQLGSLRLSVAADPRLRIGTFARAEIDAGQDCGLTVPTSAILFTMDGAVVATVQSDRVAMRRVTTGLVAGGNIGIRDGLSPDDTVVARAAAFLRDGDHVRPVPATP